ncbi:MAG: hypothetical protein HKO07_09310, partial [Pseudomonadales bacterium]|nr:hypothetical protein [Pseudomonadales bacterium]
QLEALDIAVYADDPRSFNDIARSITDFAAMAQVDPPLDMLNQQLHQPLEQLASDYSSDYSSEHGNDYNSSAQHPVEVFYEIWHEPLQTLNKTHLVNRAIALCGGRNIFADAAVLAPKVSLEAVLAADPEVIVASAPSGQRPQTLDNWYRWPSLRAAANQQLYFVHGDLLSRHTLRMVEGVQALCQHIASARRVRPEQREHYSDTQRGQQTAEAVLAGKKPAPGSP